MFRWSTIARGAVALAAGSLLGSASRPTDTEAGRAARAASTCEEFCRLVVRSSDSSLTGECHRGCFGQLGTDGGACEGARLRWMDCEIRARRRGVEALASKEPFEPETTANCAESLTRARDCAEDCRREGIVESGWQSLGEPTHARQVGYEVHHFGCSTCVVDPGAPALAVCDSAKVCASHCFECRSRRG